MGNCVDSDNKNNDYGRPEGADKGESSTGTNETTERPNFQSVIKHGEDMGEAYTPERTMKWNHRNE